MTSAQKTRPNPADSSGEAAALAVDGLVKRFAGITAVDAVTLSIRRREIVGIIGPNGSGKSTLFNLIAGAERADEGHIHLLGQDVTGQAAWRVARAGLGRTFQIPALFDNMSVYDNLFAAAVEGDWAGAPARALEAMQLLQIEHVSDNLASELSGGQQRLVEFGRAYMRNPGVVLLDEVTAGVHPNIRKIILAAIKRLQADGTTFLVIEHDMEMVREICDRVVVMDSGKIVVEGNFNEVANNDEVRQVYLGRKT